MFRYMSGNGKGQVDPQKDQKAKLQAYSLILYRYYKRQEMSKIDAATQLEGFGNMLICNNRTLRA